MKKLLLSVFALASFASYAQTTLYSDGFESYTDFAITGYGGWVTIDVDGLDTYIGGTDYGQGEWAPLWANSGDAMAFQVFNPTTATGTVTATGATEAVFNDLTGAGGETRNFDPHGGAKYAAAWGAIPDDNTAGNNDWLISPVIQLGTSGNVVKFWVKALSDTYGPEEFNTYIFSGTSATAPTATNFTQKLNLGTGTVSSFLNWVELTFNLPATYNSQQVRIGINYISEDIYMLQVDDFLVTTTGSMGVNDALSSKFSVSPNPAKNSVFVANTGAIQIDNVSIADINGRTVKMIPYGNVTDATLDISDLATGVYTMTISTPDGKAVKKIVKN
ncbi:MAG: T9SS type A sorting domain-containing protein [Flavobacterium sp.]|uniref:T9SS-dependent choice-of-anchor J family protein n=1 Tax=Flavobacterium sp. TaxID=239 RepID=UPI00120B344E|nr:choice-of-anchor J domain-containing protein [Flavobacterium sp.]RZJ63401.1 MAG: T9SS type A sorting domain-containing protein [Flavobacterium sp.]